MEKVINLLIKQVENQRLRLNNLEYITESYHDWKNEKEEFIKHIKDKAKEAAKNGTKDSVPNKQQQSISESKSSSSS